jgi:hypothetical protein
MGRTPVSLSAIKRGVFYLDEKRECFTTVKAKPMLVNYPFALTQGLCKSTEAQENQTKCSQEMVRYEA